MTEVEHIGHQGLIASIFDTFCFSEKIDALLPKTSSNQKITLAQAIQSMVHLGLGFTGKRLYSAGRFFKGFSRYIVVDMFPFNTFCVRNVITDSKRRSAGG